MSSLVDSLVKNIFNSAVVVQRKQLAPQVLHIRLQGKGFSEHKYIPGEHLRIFVGVDKNTALDSKLRTYSVWKHDGKIGSVDLAVCTHSTGIGANWARDVKVGNTVHYMGPKGMLTIEDGDTHFFIGDLSALSHMYALRNGVSSGAKTFGLVYGEDEAEYFADLDGQKPFTFLKLPENPVGELISYFEQHSKDAKGRTVIYLGGDARVCKTLGRYFRNDAGWSHATVKTKGFWMPGKTGMD